MGYMNYYIDMSFESRVKEKFVWWEFHQNDNTQFVSYDNTQFVSYIKGIDVLIYKFLCNKSLVLKHCNYIDYLECMHLPFILQHRDENTEPGCKILLQRKTDV